MAVPIGYNKTGNFNTFLDQFGSYTAVRNSDGARVGPTNVTSPNCPERAQVKGPTSKGVHIPLGSTGLKWRSPTSYSRRCHRWLYLSGTSQYVINGWTYFWTGIRIDSNPGQDNPTWVANNFGILPHDGRTQAITECLAKLIDDKVQLGTFLAEADKTAAMLADDVYKVARFLIDAKKRPWRLPRHLRPLKRPDGLWLKWRYGYRPLIQDLTDIAKQLQQGVSDVPLILQARKTITTPRGGPCVRAGRTGSYNVTLRDSCVIWATVADDFKQRVKSVGLDNPLSIGWELVPYSFVVDWFSPIGTLLKAYSAPAGLNFLAGFTSQARFGKITMPEYCGTTEQSFHIFVRERLLTWPKAGIYFVDDPFRLRDPNKDKGPRWARMVDAITLLTNSRR